MRKTIRTGVIVAIGLGGAFALGIFDNKENKNKEIDAIFSEWNHDDTPGCALGVYQNGAVIYANGYGMANLEHGIPITPESIFYLGSVSKQFTAASTLLLAHDGLVDLDAPMQTALPWLPDIAAQFTVRQGLQHVSGMRDYFDLLVLSGRMPQDLMVTDEDLNELIALQQSLNFTPGDQYSYSNTPYYLMSQIFEEKTDGDMASFAAARIFGPLGMTNSHFHTDHRHLIPKRANGYQSNDKGGYEHNMANLEAIGSGGVFSNVIDLQKWDENFYADILAPDSDWIAQMRTDTRLNNGELTGYGLGVRVEDYRGQPTVRHTGSLAGYRAAYMMMPDQHFSVAILCNSADIRPMNYAENVVDHYLSEVLDPATAEATNEVEGPNNPAMFGDLMKIENADEYVGRYFSSELQNSLRIVPSNGGIAAVLNNTPSETLHSHERDIFMNDDGAIVLSFKRAADGLIISVTLDTPRSKHLAFWKR